MVALVHPTSSLRAQAIRGTLVEAGTGMPVDGAAVVLLDEADTQISWWLTDPAGRFSFILQSSGTFRLRVDRIGLTSIRSDLIVVEGKDTVVYRLEAPVEAVVLAGLTVESSRRCEVRPGSGEATARVWEEARKALEATSQTTRGGYYRYVIRRFERELDARGRRVLKEESRIDRRLTSNPWKSLPVDDLLSGGFVRPDGDGSVYYAPDADVLLSDRFLDTHCMRLTEGRGESEGLIGLAFEPVEDRGVTEISGILWVDPATGELQWLDYRYEELDRPIALIAAAGLGVRPSQVEVVWGGTARRERLGGRVGFDGLPDGTWIVRDWSIRMPILTAARTRRGDVRTELTGINEIGGLIVRVSNPRGEVVLDSGAGIVEGVVVDSAGVAPVAGAVVILNESDQTTTNEEGHFRFPALPEGYYGLRVSNPALDALGLQPEPTYVESEPGEVSSVRLRFPGVVPALTEVCGPHDSLEGGGIITGHVRHASGDPAPGARILIRWQEVSTLAGVLRWRDKEAQVPVEREDGLYAACGLPRDLSLLISVEWDGQESRSERLRFPGLTVVVEKDMTVPPGG